MGYKILVMEENRLEIDKAREAIKALGHEMISVQNVSMAIEHMDEADGVITDFLFSPWGTGTVHLQQRAKALGYYENMPPSGTIIMIEAVARQLPIAICVELYEAGQPTFVLPQYAWFYDGYLKSFARGIKAPIDWIEHKDWAKAVERLVGRMSTKS